MPRIAHRPRPIGQPTRGKTALNRLRQIDTYIALAHAQTLTFGTPLVVDVGYGAQAWTALEMWERWQRINPRLRLLGVEIDPDRVAAAQPYLQPGRIDFRQGGFNVADILMGEKARVIRAYNVLRQYDESAVPDALATMAHALEPGGLLIEGTSTPTGRLVVFDVYRQQTAGLQHLEMVFGTNFRDHATPVDFQAILPKRLIHHALAARPAAFLAAWQRALLVARGMGQGGSRQRWQMAIDLLHEKYGYPVDTRRRIRRRGFLVLREPLAH